MNKPHHRLLFGLLMLASAIPSPAQNEPYRNPALSADERAADLLSRMTLDEKISQLNHVSSEIKHLGIPHYNWWNEVLHGVARAGTATVFPQTIGMAASFDDDAVYDTFSMISTEMRAKYNESLDDDGDVQYRGLTVWTPNINIFRDPRWGRGQETYGEDPYLTSKMGLAVVKGLQGDGSGKYDKLHACAKHFAVHSGPEGSRHSYNAENIDPRDLWETYLPAFKALVTEGGVREVMCAYNRFEGEPCCSNKKLLKNILRNEWGYDDVVVSDCGAIWDFYQPYPAGHGTHPDIQHAGADAVATGNDLECAGSAFQTLKEGIEKGLITEKDIDRSVFRLLRARFQLGNLFDDNLTPWIGYGTDSICTPSHRRQALDMARKSMVLMTNHNNTLPLDNKVRKIALVGPNANDSVMMWGNYNGFPQSTVTILDGLRKEFPLSEIEYVKGCDLADNMVLNSNFGLLNYEGVPGMKATYYKGTDMSGDPIASAFYTNPLNFTTEGATVFAPGVPLTEFSARYEASIIPEKDGVLTFFLQADDGYRLNVNGNDLLALWQDGYHDEVTYPLEVKKGEKYDITLDFFQNGGGGVLKFDLGEKREVDYAAIADQVKDADVIIFAGGLSPSLEGEEMPVNFDGFHKGDRTKIELPAVQTNMLKALKSTGKPVVFVICAGSALAIPWEARECDAILNAFYPGESGGQAVAEVISGKYNPAGRLPITFYSSTSELPDFEDYDMQNRTYRYYKGTPLFPFGHGLSFTDFKYGNGKLSKSSIKLPKTSKSSSKDEKVTLSIPLSNTGKMNGEEVVQVYVRNLQDPAGPKKSLRAFRRVPLNAGESTTVKIELEPGTFESFNTQTGRMGLLPGRYEILYGGSSDDAALKSIPFTIK